MTEVLEMVPLREHAILTSCVKQVEIVFQVGFEHSKKNFKVGIMT